MGPHAEREVWIRRAVDDELVGMDEDARVAVGGPEPEHYLLPGGDPTLAERRVTLRPTRKLRNGRGES